MTVTVQPIIVGVGVDFIGKEYEIEELPPIADVPEGAYCTIHWPGNSGWYQTEYQVVDGEWVQTYTTAPWQMFV